MDAIRDDDNRRDDADVDDWDYSDREERARTLIEGGLGHSPEELLRSLPRCAGSDGHYANVLLATCGPYGEGLGQGEPSVASPPQFTFLGEVPADLVDAAFEKWDTPDGNGLGLLVTLPEVVLVPQVPPELVDAAFEKLDTPDGNGLGMPIPLPEVKLVPRPTKTNATLRRTGRRQCVIPQRVVDRQEYLPCSDVTRLYKAAAFALYRGWPLNNYWTFSWGVVGIDEDHVAAKHFYDLRVALRRKLEQYQLPCAFIYVHEKGPKFGFHTHMLLHVAHDRQSKMEEWVGEKLAQMFGADACRKRIRPEDGKEIRLFKSDNWSSEPVHVQIELQWNKFHFRYLIKGVHEHELVPELGRGHRAKFTVAEIFDIARSELNKSLHMDILGPRAGVSQKIASGEQQEAGFVSDYDRECWGKDLYTDRAYNEGKQVRDRAEAERALAQALNGLDLF